MEKWRRPTTRPLKKIGGIRLDTFRFSDFLKFDILRSRVLLKTMTVFRLEPSLLPQQFLHAIDVIDLQIHEGQDEVIEHTDRTAWVRAQFDEREREKDKLVIIQVHINTKFFQ